MNCRPFKAVADLRSSSYSVGLHALQPWQQLSLVTMSLSPHPTRLFDRVTASFAPFRRTSTPCFKSRSYFRSAIIAWADDDWRRYWLHWWQFDIGLRRDTLESMKLLGSVVNLVESVFVIWINGKLIFPCFSLWWILVETVYTPLFFRVSFLIAYLIKLFPDS